MPICAVAHRAVIPVHGPQRLRAISRPTGDHATVGLAMMNGPQAQVVWFGVADRALRDPVAEAARTGGTGARCPVLTGLEVWVALTGTALV